MLTEITIRNFKSFRHAEVNLRAMNLLVGANASGKSNFFDALRVLQGIGAGATVTECLDGRPTSAASETTSGGIRGGSAFASHHGERAADRFEITVTGQLPGGPGWRYTIGISPASGKVARENLVVAGYDYFDTPAGDLPDRSLIGVRRFTGVPGGLRTWWMDRARPVLQQFVEQADAPRERRRVAEEIAGQFADILCFDPSPHVLRRYSEPHADRMGERGENFAAVVAALCADAGTKARYLAWLRELRAEEVDDAGTLRGAPGESMFLLRERGREFPATALGDGTLRFAAIVAAFFQPAAPGLLAIEGIEKGIHANRARVLVELMRRLSADGAPQVIATTHSPTALEWLTASDYASTFFCRRDPETREATIRPLLTLDYAGSALASASLGELFAEGWMEAASDGPGPSRPAEDG